MKCIVCKIIAPTAKMRFKHVVMHQHVFILVRFLAHFAVFCLFLWIVRDFMNLLEFQGSAMVRNFRSPVHSNSDFVALKQLFIFFYYMYSAYYTSAAILCHPSLSTALVNKLYDLNDLEFDLPCGGHDLDISWPAFSRYVYWQ